MQSIKLRVVIATLVASCCACADEEPTTPTEPQPLEIPEIPAPTSPENLLRAIEVIFNDTVRSSSERYRAYADLFASDFECDCPPQYPFILKQARGLFESQETGEIFELRADIDFLPATDLDPPQPGRENWKSVFVTNLGYRILTTPQDGYQETGCQATILAQPAPGGSRWFIAEWVALPRPAPQ